MDSYLGLNWVLFCCLQCIDPHHLHDGELKLYWQMLRMDDHLFCVTLDVSIHLTGKEKVRASHCR